jgi:hypothetical protein
MMGFVTQCGVQTSAVMIQPAVSHEYIGVATALAVTVRSLGGSVATTIYTTILANNISANLGKTVASYLLKSGLPSAELGPVVTAFAVGNSTSLALTSLPPNILAAGEYGLKVAWANAFRMVYLVSIAFGVMGTVCAAFTLNVYPLMNNTLDIKLQEGSHIHGQADTHTGHIIHHDDLDDSTHVEHVGGVDVCEHTVVKG